MKFENLSLIYFSPTSTTQTVLKEIAKGLGKKIHTVINITDPQIRNHPAPEFKSDVVLIGTPVYAGRIPKDAADYLKTINGSDSLAIVVVLYGNREFEDALVELKNIADDSGFIPVAAAAFIGEHSFSNDVFPIAVKRPDKEDLEKAFLFGKQIAFFLKGLGKSENLVPVAVPGNFPYKEGVSFGGFKFIDVTEDCDNCEQCVTACPMEAIDALDHYSTRPEYCIYCCACIKACPWHARILKDSPIKEKLKWLYENCAFRKEPQTFLSGDFYSR